LIRALFGAACHPTPNGGSISGDGRRAVFTSPATNLVPADSNATDDVFVRIRPGATG
jgi:hypothetical protein